MNITGILLAAGKSARMPGKNKLLLPYRDQTIIECCLSQLIDSQLSQIIIVIGFEADRMRQTLSSYQSERVQLVINSTYEDGRANSIKAGLEKCGPTDSGALFMVADKPTIKADLINSVISEFESESYSIVAVKTPNGRGHPIIFNRSLFAELLELKGDVAGEDLIARHADDISWVEDSKPQFNINSPADYQQLLAAEEIARR